MKLRNIYYGPNSGGYGGAPSFPNVGGGGAGILGKILGGAGKVTGFLGQNATPIGIGLSVAGGLAPLAYQLITAGKQKREAEKARLLDPGYQMNEEVIRNANRTTQAYNNYQLPGKNELSQQVDQNFATSVAGATQGASSSNDILEAAISSMYGANQADTNIATAEAQGKMGMLDRVLQSRAAAGGEYQNKNAYDRDQYQKSVEGTAALREASNRNGFNATQSVAMLGNAFLNYKTRQSSPSSTGTVSTGAPIFNY